jgi:antitoxin ParD1/3/4
MGMTSLNISLPATLRQYVERQVEAGGYSTPSEYVRDLVRSDAKRRAEEKLGALLDEALSTETMPADADYWKRGRKELAARLKQARKRK